MMFGGYAAARAVVMAMGVLFATAPALFADKLEPKGRPEDLRVVRVEECTIVVEVSTPYHNNQANNETDNVLSARTSNERFLCEMDPSVMGGIAGLMFPIEEEVVERKKLRQKLERGKVVSSESMLRIGGDVGISDSRLSIPDNQELRVVTRKTTSDRRRLAKQTGISKVLVVNVVDNAGRKGPHSPGQK